MVENGWQITLQLLGKKWYDAVAGHFICTIHFLNEVLKNRQAMTPSHHLRNQLWVDKRRCFDTSLAFLFGLQNGKTEANFGFSELKGSTGVKKFSENLGF